MRINLTPFHYKTAGLRIVQLCIVQWSAMHSQWRMLWKPVGLSFLALSLMACSAATEELSDNTKASLDINNDLVIANALYFNKRIPDGFYHENTSADLYGSLSHVKNTTILPIVDRAGLAVYELASNNFTEALAWDELTTVHQPLYSQLVANSETDLYYQFTRVNPDLPELNDISRVFKANMLDRNGVDRTNEDSIYQGRITQSIITAASIKHILEYLWTFSFSNNFGNAIMESYTEEMPNEFIHIMKLAKINFSHSDACDTVEMYEIRYTVARANGLIWKDKQLMRSFLTKRSGNTVEVCA